MQVRDWDTLSSASSNSLTDALVCMMSGTSIRKMCLSMAVSARSFFITSLLIARLIYSALGSADARTRICANS